LIYLERQVKSFPWPAHEFVAYLEANKREFTVKRAIKMPQNRFLEPKLFQNADSFSPDKIANHQQATLPMPKMIANRQ